jgi:Tfp pilus assembly protein PilO
MPLNFDLGKVVKKRKYGPGGPRMEGALGEAAPFTPVVVRKTSLGVWKIVIGALAAANLLAFFLVVKPPGGSAAELDEQLRSLRQQVQLKRISARRMTDLVKKVEGARGSQEQFINAHFMERRTASAEILTEIGEATKKAGLKPKEHAFAIEGIEGADQLAMMTITANYEGTYGQLVDFVNMIDRSKRFLIIDNIQAAPQLQSGLLSVRFKINAFVREDARAAAMVAQAAAAAAAAAPPPAAAAKPAPVIQTPKPSPVGSIVRPAP